MKKQYNLNPDCDCIKVTLQSHLSTSKVLPIWKCGKWIIGIDISHILSENGIRKPIKWILWLRTIQDFESFPKWREKWGWIDTPIWPHFSSSLSSFLLLSPVNNPWFWQSYFWHNVCFGITRKRTPRLASSRRDRGSRELLNWSGKPCDTGLRGPCEAEWDPLSNCRTVRKGEGGYLLFGWAVNF